MEFGGFVGPAYEARSRYQDAQRCINWYLEVDSTPGAASAAALYPTPGLLDYITPGGTGPVRGLYVSPSETTKLYVVIGSSLYSIVESGGVPGATLLGTLGSSVNPVSMSDNGTTLLIVDGPNGYTVTLASGAFAQISDPAFYGSARVAYVDGFFCLNRPDTQQFYISGLYAVTWDALDFAAKEAWPDKLVATWANNRELWLFGQYSTEIWHNQPLYDNAGNFEFQFQRLGNAFMQHGCAAPYSLSKIGETFAWVGTDERGASSIWIANGYAPQKISTTAIDNELSTYSQVSDAIGFSYRALGHEFYQVTFPSADKTWVYDLTTSLWHERASMDSQGDLHRHRANCFVEFGGKLLVGDYNNGSIYEYDSDTYSDDGSAIPRIRRCPHILANRNQVIHDSVQVIFHPGVGLQTGQGSDPQAMLRWSNDGGSNFGNEHWQSIGRVGKYETRAMWDRLGVARDRVYELTITDPIFACVIGAEIAVRPGQS
jgi:hypothetical protein